MARSGSKIMLLVALGLLMGAPIISYFYLNSGYQYRLESLHALRTLGEVKPFNLITDAQDSVSDDDLSGMVTAMAWIQGKQEEYTFLEDLADQYKDRHEFQILAINSGQDHDWQPLGPITQIESSPVVAETLFKNSITDTISFQEPMFVLLDTASQIRHIYSGKFDSIQLKLVEHIAIVLPRTKKSDIIHKRLTDEK